MNYLSIPEEITSIDIFEKNQSLSAGMYRQVNIPNKGKRPLKELLDPINPYDKGIEPGTLNYVKKSPYKLIRTKALKFYSYLISTKGDSVIYIKPKVFNHPGLKSTDILLSKDSNIGESCMVYGIDSDDFTFSGGVVRLNPIIDRFYLYSFLKHPIFKTELDFLTARGATIRHAGDAFERCNIPFPTQNNKDFIISYVSMLMQLIVEKEFQLQQKSKQILTCINEELLGNQSKTGAYEFPNIKEIINEGRLDTSLYIPEFKEVIDLVKKYKNGFTTFSQSGFNVIPGPSLEIKIIKTRIDSDVPVKGYYNLILPTNISEHGILNKMQYLGTPKVLPLLEYGDILVGEAGFGKGRSFVLLDNYEKCTTNAHGIIIRRTDKDITQAIMARCIVYWYRENGLFDLLGVGGSGGHLSPEYFETILLPNFPSNVVKSISELYYNPVGVLSTETMDLSNVFEIEKERNKHIGIVNLKNDIETLKDIMLDIQNQIILDKDVKLTTN